MNQMEQWEYEVLAVNWDQANQTWQVSGPMEFTASTLAEVFNRMGEAGWEMVGLTPYAGDLTGGAYGGTWEARNYRAIFKRRKQ
jgi:hypothetical protein